MKIKQKIEDTYKLVDDVKERIKELSEELNSLNHLQQSTFSEYFQSLGLKFEEGELKLFFKKPYILFPKAKQEWYCIVPCFIPFQVGYFDRREKNYNIFIINKYSRWINDIPDFMLEEIDLEKPDNIYIRDGELIFEEKLLDKVRTKYGHRIKNLQKDKATIKQGHEFDLIAELIEEGNLPFIPKAVDKEDLRKPELKFITEGKYKFQEDAYKEWLKWGSLGVYWATGCFDIETEILTEGGWKKYNEISYNDKFATLNKKTFEIEYHKPYKLINYLYEGKMFNLETRQANINVTPDHNMFIAKVNGDGKKVWRICKPTDIHNKKCYFKKNGIWVGKDADFFVIPKLKLKSRTIKEKRIPIKEFVKFFGLWLAEGHTSKDSRGNYQVAISMFDDNLLKEMLNYCKSWGYNPHISKRNGKNYRLLILNKQLYSYLKQFGKASEKYIPAELKQLPPDLLRDLILYFEYGDGEHWEGATRLITSSKKLRDDFQEIALKSGWSANYSIRMKKGQSKKIEGRLIKAKQDIWRITIVKKQNEFLINPYCSSSKSKWNSYNGLVWCVNVPNNIIYVRRKGKTWWSGNSGKSFLAMKVFDSLKYDEKNRRKLLVTITTTLVDQWKLYFEEYAPRLLKEVEIITYNAFHKVKNGKYIMVVFDENDRLPADTFSKFATINTKYRLGLSATPYREDGRTQFIFALTGYPVGMNWDLILKILGKKLHKINVYILKLEKDKIRKVRELLDINKKTLIFSDSISLGKQISKNLNVPFIYGSTKKRLSILEKNKVNVVSRVMDYGVSIKNLQHIIEADFLFGSRKQQVQRTGRLLHTLSKSVGHDILFTQTEFQRYKKRLFGLMEKGFQINFINEASIKKIGIDEVDLRPMKEIKLPEKKKEVSPEPSEPDSKIIYDKVDYETFLKNEIVKELINKALEESKQKKALKGILATILSKRKGATYEEIRKSLGLAPSSISEVSKAVVKLEKYEIIKKYKEGGSNKVDFNIGGMNEIIGLNKQRKKSEALIGELFD